VVRRCPRGGGSLSLGFQEAGTGHQEPPGYNHVQIQNFLKDFF